LIPVEIQRPRILLIKDQFDVSRIPETWKFLSWSLFRERFERSEAIERLERFERTDPPDERSVSFD